MAPLPKIIFTNQFTGYLFIDIVNVFANKGYECQLYTGHIDGNKALLNDKVKVSYLIRYNRNVAYKRIFTWLFFTLQSFFRLIILKAHTELFIVSNPPFSPFLGYIFYKLRGIRYHLLIYDVYPDALVQLEKAKEGGFINQVWGKMNYHLFKHASTIYTLSESMAGLITDYNKNIKVEVIPNWADTAMIKPISKSENPFADKYEQTDKITIMYSGNMGATHAIEKIAELAASCINDDSFGFLLIGDGSKKQMLVDLKSKNNLHNLTILPYQAREAFPYSVACADIGIVTLSAGAEDLSVPSKTYNLLAAGVALLVIASPKSELAKLVHHYKCGVSFEQHETEQMRAFLLAIKKDPARLLNLKMNAQSAAKYFTPANATQYLDALNSNRHVS